MYEVKAKQQLSYNDVKYLTSPGAILIAQPQLLFSGVEAFGDFVTELDPAFAQYVDDPTYDPISNIVKLAGQACYQSYGPRRRFNRDTDKYIENLLQGGHGSVLEHVNFTVFLYGIGRDISHEIVRHRAGFAYSQLSQRYVDDEHIRFVMRPEYKADEGLTQTFFDWCKQSLDQYAYRAARLLHLQHTDDTFSALSSENKTDARKKVNQAARACLPNETETQMFITANARAWRHFLTMRGARDADFYMREVALNIFTLLYAACPTLFQDFTVTLADDGGPVVQPKYAKV